MSLAQILYPTEVGQRVRASSYGGKVRRYHVGLIGTVVRFTAAGNPVVTFGGEGVAETTVTDTTNCFRRITDTGMWVREESA